MADLSFDGKVAVITGAGGGLGFEHAKVLASRGAQLVINDLGGTIDGSGDDSAAAAKAAKEIESMGGVAVPNFDSVATVEGGENIIKTAIDTYGKVDIVINNAGILRDVSFHKQTDAEVQSVIAVHLEGAFNVTRAAWSHMRDQGYGRVLMTSSGAGIFGNFGQTNYGAAKMGLVGLARVLAVEGAKYNIKANCIAPIAYTRMTADLPGFDALEDALKPGLVSPIACWLVHEDCDVSGEVYSVGGGRVARVFIGETPGYFDRELTMEAVRDNWGQIRDEEGYVVPSNLNDEIGLLLKHFA